MSRHFARYAFARTQSENQRAIIVFWLLMKKGFMQVTYTTKQNQSGTDKPNEDYVLVQPPVYIVCDGVTRTLIDNRYPIPSPAAEASRIFAHAALKAVLESQATFPRERLMEGVRIGNEAVGVYNRERFSEIDYLQNDFAGTVAIVALIENQTLHYAYIGDCGGYLIRNGSISTFTHPQTEKIATYPHNYTIVQIRRDIRNNIAHEFCYGVFTGEETALSCVEYGEIPLQTGDQIILISDGLAPYLDAPPLLPLPSLGEIIAAMEGIERETRIRSDDKTIIRVEVI
jgi:serine/threonine protein phosphatase PrpC